MERHGRGKLSAQSTPNGAPRGLACALGESSSRVDREKRVAEASLPAEYFLHQEKGVGARVRLAADSTYLVNVSVVIRERVSLELG